MDRLLKMLKDYSTGLVSREEIFQELISGELVIIASYKSLKDTAINIQDYIYAGKHYIPIFSDASTAHRLLQGIQFALGMQLNEIKADFLFEMFKGNEWLIVNASDEFAFEMFAYEVKPFLPRPETPALVSENKGLGGRRLVLTKPTAMKIGVPSDPPSAEVLTEMREALVSTKVRHVYWFWISISGGPEHLALVVTPNDEEMMNQVGRAIEPIWMKYRPDNSLISMLPLDLDDLSEALRTQGQILYDGQK